jgi:hypothetical protein
MRDLRLGCFAVVGALALVMAPSVSFAQTAPPPPAPTALSPAVLTEAEQIAAAQVSIKAALDALPADASASETTTAINSATGGFGPSIVSAALKSLIDSGTYTGGKLAGLTSVQAVALASVTNGQPGGQSGGQSGDSSTGGIPAFTNSSNNSGGNNNGGVPGSTGSFEYRK